ncbi:MAG TPA: hypothetical protein V6C84_01320 [Coleofasciculaceae cyanobacterium]|jgi:hypothetical protein
MQLDFYAFDLLLMLLDDLPKSFLSTAPAPKFQIGDQVCWHPLPTQEFGVVTGLEYAPAAHLLGWSWKYVVWLDPRSPSHEWIRQDSAWEDDLALYSPELEMEEQP